MLVYIPIIWTFGLSAVIWYYCTAILYILWSFGIFFPRFGKLHQTKSGNPGEKWQRGPADFCSLADPAIKCFQKNALLVWQNKPERTYTQTLVSLQYLFGHLSMYFLCVLLEPSQTDSKWENVSRSSMSYLDYILRLNTVFERTISVLPM
jgi:hypothetical protein